MTPIEALLQLAQSRAPRCGQTRIIAVDGPSGSGKTTLAQELVDALSRQGPSVQIVQTVHMDDLYPGWDGLEAAVPRLAQWVLEPLAQGRDGAYRRYDWERGAYAEWHPVPVAAWLVVEGVGCGAQALADHYSALWWIEADRAERMRRGLARDGETYAPHWERWAAQEELVFAGEGTRRRADVVTDTTVQAHHG